MAEPERANRPGDQPLPVEISRLIHAVDRVRDQWAGADADTRLDLWAAVRYETDLVWSLLGSGVPSGGDSRG